MAKVHPLKLWLLENDRSQRWLAGEVAVSESHLSAVLAGDEEPGADLTRRLVRATGGEIDADAILFHGQRKPAA